MALRAKGEEGRLAAILGSVGLATLLGNAATLVVLPIITRQYTPSDIGSWGTALALATFGSVVLMQGMPILIQNSEAERLPRILCGWAKSVIGIIVFALLSIGLLLGIATLDPQWEVALIASVPLAVSFGLLEVSQASRLRLGDLNKIRTARYIQSLSTAVGWVLLGFVSPSAVSLIAVQVLGAGAAAGFMVVGRDGPAQKWVAVRRQSPVVAGDGSRARRGINQPMMLVRVQAAAGGLATVALLQAPVLVSSYFYGVSTTGEVVAAVRLLSVPAAYFGVSAALRLERGAGQLLRINAGGSRLLLTQFQQRMLGRAVLSGLAILISTLWLPDILGPEFADTAWYVRILLLGYVLQIVGGPSLRFIQVLNRHGKYLVVAWTRACLALLPSVALGLMGAPIDVVLWAFSIGLLAGFALVVASSRSAAKLFDDQGRSQA